MFVEIFNFSQSNNAVWSKKTLTTFVGECWTLSPWDDRQIMWWHHKEVTTLPPSFWKGNQLGLMLTLSHSLFLSLSPEKYINNYFTTNSTTSWQAEHKLYLQNIYFSISHLFLSSVTDYDIIKHWPDLDHWPSSLCLESYKRRSQDAGEALVSRKGQSLDESGGHVCVQWLWNDGVSACDGRSLASGVYQAQ